MNLDNKKILVLICVAFIFIVLSNFNKAYASSIDYKKVTTSPEIQQSLTKLENTSYKWVLDTIAGDNLSKRPIVIKFRKLSYISVDYRNFLAISLRDTSGRIVILLDSSLKNSPAEAIASLITHEVIHQDSINSIEEETQGWTNEAKSWAEFKNSNKELCNIDENLYPLVKRLNNLSKLYEKANNSSILIKLAVLRNTGYEALAANYEGSRP